MKMKEACQATALTERAIRLYIARELISPEQRNGVMHFSADDIRALRDIAILRRHDFSIDQISVMFSDPSAIQAVVLQSAEKAAAESEHGCAVNEALGAVKGRPIGSVGELAARLQERHALPSNPNFAQFDEISDEDRLRETQMAAPKRAQMEKRTRRIKRLLIVSGALIAITVIIGIYLSQTRIAGYISIAPITILEKQDDRMTVSIDDPRAAEAIGQERITVPYFAFGRPDEVGNTLSTGVQLAIQLTNYDLMCLGINPLQSFRTQSVSVNQAWLETILHALFETEISGQAKLWIREISNLRPLFGQHERYE